MFGPSHLKAVLQEMIHSGFCRRTVNQRAARVVQVLGYGVEHERVPVAAYWALKEVPGLRAGRLTGKESRAVTPVPDGDVEVVLLLPIPTPQLRAVVELLRWIPNRPNDSRLRVPAKRKPTAPRTTSESSISHRRRSGSTVSIATRSSNPRFATTSRIAGTAARPAAAPACTTAAGGTRRRRSSCSSRVLPEGRSGPGLGPSTT